MPSRIPRPLLTAAALCISALSAVTAVARPAAAQQTRPSPQEAEALLRRRPDLQTQVEQRLRSSGLTPDQVRARLRAEGYPESLLDQYLSGGGARRGGNAPSASSRELIDAMDALGLADSLDVELLRDAEGGAGARDSLRRRGGRIPTGSRDFPRDTLVIDSTRLLDPARLPDTTRRARGDTLRRRTLDALLEPERRDSIARVDSTRRARQAARDSGLAIFGLDLFRQETSLFDPNLAGPVDENYRLGPGDRLMLLLTGDVESAIPLTVTREGFVLIPQVGQLYVASLTLGQLEDLLYARLGRAYSGVRRGPGARTRFSVSVVQLRSNQVFVVGDVERPGSYRISSAGTALTALYAAGGPTEAGSLRRIEIRRGGRVASVLDVYDYLVRGDAARDVRLETGDVVFVPPRLARVRATGEVLRPATYELRPGETLRDLVQAAGGLTALAAPSAVQIERVVPAAQRSAGGRDRVVVQATSGADGSLPALPLANGDVVRVARIADRVRNRLVVRGNVWRPGAIGFRPGLRLSEALRAAGGIRPDTYLGRVLVARLTSDSTRVQLRDMLRDTTGAAVQDLVLQDDDEIQVFSSTEFRPERYVAIAGAVRDGGRFRYREGMTLRDLTLLAGGLSEGALVDEAEIARLPEERTAGVTARTVRVRLDSSYVTADGDDQRTATAPEVVLEPYDQVLILRQPDFRLPRSVFVGGEVRFPGAYGLRTQGERLSDVIERAGGLTPRADANGVTFYRTQGQLGRIGVDLRGVLRDARNRENLVLVDGDSIVVAPRELLVLVDGAVNAPTAVTYVPGADLDYYVRAAGGPSARADLSRAYVRQANGKLASVRRRPFLPDDVPEPDAGAQVFVPERLARVDSQGVGQFVGIIVQVVGAVAALLLALSTTRN